MFTLYIEREYNYTFLENTSKNFLLYTKIYMPTKIAKQINMNKRK